MKRSFAIAVSLFVVNAWADPARPIAKWEARVAPLDNSSGFLTYPVGRSGPTMVPAAGSPWACGVQAPASPRAGLERATLICMAPGGYTVTVMAKCSAGGSAAMNTIQISPPKDGPSYIVALVCEPLPPPAAPAPKPIEKSL